MRHIFLKAALVLAVLVIALTVEAPAALALQKGLVEDFNGCSKEADKAKREICCESVEEDCTQTCSDQFGRDGKPGGLITCEWDCDTGVDSCKDGDLFPEVTTTHICRFDQSKDKTIVELNCMFEFTPNEGFELPELPNYKK
ncbi:hypothetical protein [Falsiphaeobacter marinintestinus]|uniref:hypothetical protein n=1 Tax=Falsiphaeobacter marinintestinus TaxID=1492905 RepID=UPI0011B726B3|nr:hypothetical protein [Phaeobacter marinintestinus]